MRLQVEIQNIQVRNTALEEQYEQLQDDYAEAKRNAPAGRIIPMKPKNN